MWLILLLFVTVPPAYSQSSGAGAIGAQEETALEIGRPVERELAGGQKHIYRLAMIQGQYASVMVGQHGIDIVARLFSADGQIIADVDGERTAQGFEKIELVGEQPGSYRIEIMPTLPKADLGRYVIRLSEVRESTTNEKLLDEAFKQHYESLRLKESGKTDKAIELANRALETRENILGPAHPAVAASLRSLGALYAAKNDFTRAEAVFQRAGEVTAKTSGTDSLDYADVLNGLGPIKFYKGDITQSEQLFQRSLSIREKIAGPESAPVASAFGSLALFYRLTNDLPKAEQMYLSALAIREKLLGADHAEMSPLLNDVGLFYYAAGDYSSAEPLLLRALAIREKVSGSVHEMVGRISNNLGLLEWKKRDYDKAEAYFRRAMDVFEKLSGPESSGVAGSLHNLGIIYKEGRQDYPKAEECYLRALAIWEKVFGKESSSIATAAGSLGILYRDMGDYDRAEGFQLRALAINEKLLGPNNRETIRSLISLARLYAIKGDIERSVEYQRRISESEEKIISLNLTIGSERQKVAYFTQLQQPDRVISLHVGLASDNRVARDLATATILQRKGRVLDALSKNLSALRGRFDQKDQALLDSLSDINSRLSELVLSGPQRKPVAEWQNQIAILEKEREKLESEISRSSAGFYQASQPITRAAVQAVIPHGAALIEFAVYRPFGWKTANDQSPYGEPRYVVYVMRDRGEVRWAELGATKEVDAAIGAFREALRDSHRRDVQELARAVDEKVMRPVRALIGDAKQLLISPDGELNLIPFEALVDDSMRYLVERYAFTYLTSGRDLLRMQVAREGKGKPMVVANPSFGEPPADNIAKANTTQKPAARTSKRRSVTNARSLSEVYFAPLAGTMQEARSIQMLFPEARLLIGEQAAESAIKHVSAPPILHIATHGFFLTDEPHATDTRGTRAISASAKIENPLLRSGLALAGANLRSSDGNDGILTALEASGLNLWGTKLVVLSACDTGVGEVKNGEGVYGLRRAFALAGTETLVMSLWPVSDYITREIMTAYYRGLKQGSGRGEALRQVQLGMLKRRGREHPFYWASFIQSGEWANLEGKR
jgi:CHAT domain-containing protein/Tfp pilus assembly protein PilF